jgi:hypothetical protein
MAYTENKKLIGLDAKTTPIDADVLVVGDTVDSDRAKKTTWANIKVTLKAYFDTLYLSIANSWTTWTPTFANFTKGSATITARYTTIGKTVNYYMSVKLAADSSMGTNPNFSLPVTAVSYPASTPIGQTHILDAGTETFLGVVLPVGTAAAEFIIGNASGTYLSYIRATASVPMTWTTNDTFEVSGTYEAA